MKINPVSEKFFYKSSSKKSNNVVSTNKQLVSDCFVKSNNISFSASSPKEQRQKAVDSYIRELEKKVWTTGLSISDISNSMRKYVKNVAVKPMSQAPKELLFSNNLQGLYCEELAFDDSTNRFLIPKKNRVFYTRTETLKGELGSVWVFVNSAHELTHALQSDDSTINQVGLFNAYVDKNKANIDDAVNQVTATIGTLNMIEENIARPFITLLTNNENMAYERMQSGQKDMFSWLCRKNKTEDFSEYVKEKTLAGIQSSEKTHGIALDKRLVLDATINHFEKEIEAYENENRAFKMCLKMDSPRALARVQIYQKAIDVLKEMKKEIV